MLKDRMEIIGWIGSVCFSVCALPQAIDCIRRKSAEGISGLFLLLWFSGEVLTLVYVLGFESPSAPLLANYAFNLCCLIPIIRWKLYS